MKKSVIALILLAVLIIIVSPGIVGKLAENSVGENLNWAAEESGELVVTTTGFDRGWFVSEGQHRVELKDGSIRSLLSAAASDDGDATLPVLLINTRIDHGLVPITSMSREQGSLAPGLGSAVSTLSVEFGPGETIALPGTIYSKVGLGGGLESR
ncbi:MAG: YdgA family protein, partial [Gammaproteobacteria bacterium]|nr:YdgA family protein [Gammaproteobacteria bacterium]